MASGEVRLVDLVKRFGDFTAVAGINLDMPSGEFFSLLGPSGCGKTTTLRMIAGFERPSEGQILLDGDDMAQTPPHKRNVNTVFQNYALFPHLTVADNVAFGLKYKKARKQETTERVGSALELVQMSQFANRRPSQLSGGQQQRVALARALILNPAVLLLDEPLGALDAKLRKRLQIELKALQEEVGITFIYVTHDQEEALTMRDRIAVMSQGRVEQVGGPKEIYEEPATAYVADFLGVSNLMDATASGAAAGGCKVQLGEFELIAGQGEDDATGAVQGHDPARARGPRSAGRPAGRTGSPPWSSAWCTSARCSRHHPSGLGPDDPGLDAERRSRRRAAVRGADHGALPARKRCGCCRMPEPPSCRERRRRLRRTQSSDGRRVRLGRLRPSMTLRRTTAGRSCPRRCRRCRARPAGRSDTPRTMTNSVAMSIRVAAALTAGVGEARAAP